MHLFKYSKCVSHSLGFSLEISDKTKLKRIRKAPIVMDPRFFFTQTPQTTAASLCHGYIVSHNIISEL